MAITIDNSRVSDKPWGDVNKTDLEHTLQKDGNTSVIRETYAIVQDLDKVTTWKLPHHEVVGDTLVINRGGVFSAAQRLSQTQGSPAEIKKAARHLLKHYKEMKEDPPQSLIDAAKVAKRANRIIKTSLASHKALKKKVKKKFKKQMAKLADQK